MPGGKGGTGGTGNELRHRWVGDQRPLAHNQVFQADFPDEESHQHGDQHQNSVWPVFLKTQQNDGGHYPDGSEFSQVGEENHNPVQQRIVKRLQKIKKRKLQSPTSLFVIYSLYYNTKKTVRKQEIWTGLEMEAEKP